MLELGRGLSRPLMNMCLYAFGDVDGDCTAGGIRPVAGRLTVL